jgi:hypothetical protein
MMCMNITQLKSVSVEKGTLPSKARGVPIAPIAMQTLDSYSNDLYNRFAIMRKKSRWSANCQAIHNDGILYNNHGASFSDCQSRSSRKH